MISIRTKRFLKIWGMYFGIIAGGLTAFIGISSGIIYGMMLLGEMYGPAVPITAGIIALSLFFVGWFAWAIATDELKRREAKEENVLDALKKDYNDPVSALDKRLNEILNKQYKNYPLKKKYP